MPDEKHFYDLSREAIEEAIASLDDNHVSYAEMFDIGRAAVNAVKHFTEALGGEESHFELLVGDVNRGLDDVFLILDTPGTDLDWDIPWVPEMAEEAAIGFVKSIVRADVRRRLTARRAQIIGG